LPFTDRFVITFVNAGAVLFRERWNLTRSPFTHPRFSFILKMGAAIFFRNTFQLPKFQTAAKYPKIIQHPKHTYENKADAHDGFRTGQIEDTPVGERTEKYARGGGRI
jgi:hypothetical protein